MFLATTRDTERPQTSVRWQYWLRSIVECLALQGPSKRQRPRRYPDLSWMTCLRKNGLAWSLSSAVVHFQGGKRWLRWRISRRWLERLQARAPYEVTAHGRTNWLNMPLKYQRPLSKAVRVEFTGDLTFTVSARRHLGYPPRIDPQYQYVHNAAHFPVNIVSN